MNLSNKWLISESLYGSMVSKLDAYTDMPMALDDGGEFQVEDVSNGEASVAIIPVSGILYKGATKKAYEAVGLFNTDWVGFALDDALADDKVTSIVLFFDSPGGEATGIEELYRKIKAADAIKPVYCWTETKCGSAAMWLFSAGRIGGMTPSATIGSVGVYQIHQDVTEKLKKEGITLKPFYVGKNKLMRHGMEPLTKEQEVIMDEEMVALYNKFASDVKANKPIADEDLQGLAYSGDVAFDKGFVEILTDDFASFLTTAHNIDTEQV